MIVGSVYQARRADSKAVAVKVINLNGLPPARSQSLVRTYLNEVGHLQRLRQASRHVVVIYDFDFDPRSGQGIYKTNEILCRQVPILKIKRAFCCCKQRSLSWQFCEDLRVRKPIFEDKEL